MKTETEKILDQLLLKDLFVVWEHAKTGELNDLNELDRQLAGIMLEHKEIYYAGFENPREESIDECAPGNDIDPYIHVIFHTVIEHQLKTGDPPQVKQFSDSMLQQGVARHEVMHLIGCFLSELLYGVIVEDQVFDQQRYETLLERYTGKAPEMILEEMDLPAKKE